MAAREKKTAGERMDYMNETILMVMLVAIMVFFFIFGMVGYERSKRNNENELTESEKAYEKHNDRSM